MKAGIHTLLGLFAVGLIGFLVWVVSRSREPMYEGRTLGRWLEDHIPHVVSVHPPPGSPEWNKADEALRQIGTNAIPTLLEMIRATDRSPIHRSLEGWKRLRISRPAYKRNREAAYAFEVLGSNAVSAVPQLIQICLEDPSSPSMESAVKALGHIGPGAQAAVPVLMSHFSNRLAGETIAAVLAIGADPNILSNALSVAVTSSIPMVRRQANITLHQYASEGRTGTDPRLVAGALRLTLRDAEDGLMAVHALARLGDAARIAVPDLLSLLGNPEVASLRHGAERALWLIAPELLGFLHVEGPTPLVNGVVTAQVLEVAMNGERHTLIPAGTRIPGVFSLPGLDGVGPIRLYRGPRLTSVEPTHLGTFEVHGLPASAGRTNVSIVCFVTELQIALGARDNDRGVPLEIRRIDRGAGTSRR